jgi:pimeloyl-ACP methyl ester carboxylesterase
LKNKIEFVLIPGGGMSNWLWEKLEPYLGIDSIKIDRRLLLNTYENRINAQFDDCISYIMYELAKSKLSNFILVSHSVSGILACAIAKAIPDKVRHIVFIAANIPASGKTFIDELPVELQEQNLQAVKQLVKYDSIPIKHLEIFFRYTLCNTCSEDEIEFILKQSFQPEPLCILDARMDWGNYPKINRTYIVLTQDNSLSIPVQEKMASNLLITNLKYIDSGHLVMISHPRELAIVLNEIVKNEL